MEKYGELNAHAVGIILKELVRRALVEIRYRQFTFDVYQKVGYDGKASDMLTSADGSAQELYETFLRESFPDAGILGEENQLRIPPKNGSSIYFTVDPLDGTKAFTRRQSHGVGSMIAMVEGYTVISAFVGDVNTFEIYGYRPGSKKCHRIKDMRPSEHLLQKDGKRLAEQYALLRDPLEEYSHLSRKFVEEHAKSYQIDGGSIGTWLARLWKQEVGAALLPPSYETPWDRAPVLGICQQLGYVFLAPDEEKTSWEVIHPEVPQEPYKRPYDLLVVHQDNLEEVL